MGCCNSKPEIRPQILNISGPIGGLELVPLAQRDKDGMPLHHEHHDLNRDDLQQALTHAANYVNSKDTDIVMVTAGGAVNTILLQTRDTTNDVDFFVPQDQQSLGRLLMEASQTAQRQSSVPLGGT